MDERVANEGKSWGAGEWTKQEVEEETERKKN